MEESKLKSEVFYYVDKPNVSLPPNHKIVLHKDLVAVGLDEDEELTEMCFFVVYKTLL